MTGVEWVAAGVSLVGAGLAYVGARHGSRPEEQAVTQSRRDEWGRRFATAIDLLSSDSTYSREMGLAMIEALLQSDLAQPDDRRFAEQLLDAATTADLPGRVTAGPPLRAVPNVDDVHVVEDDGEDGDDDRRGR